VAKDSIRNYLSKWLKDRNATPSSAKTQAAGLELAKIRGETSEPPAEQFGDETSIEKSLDRLQIGPVKEVVPLSVEESLRAIIERLDRIESRLDTSDECLKQLTIGAGGVVDRLTSLESNSDEQKRQGEVTSATVSRLGSVVFGAAQAMERTRDAFADLEDRRKAEREKLSMMIGFGLLIVVLIGIAVVVLVWNR